MEPVSNINRVVSLLRQRLEERERLLRKTRPGRQEEAGEPGPARGLDALARLDGLDEAALRRALVQTLLAEQFGHGMVNDAQFQQIVERVADAINFDPASARLMSRLLADIRTRTQQNGKPPAS